MAEVLDSTLIEVKQIHGVGIFFSVTLITVISLTIAWGWTMEKPIQFKTPFGFTTEEYNVAELLRATRTQDAEIAIVGSSLSKRLESGFFDKKHLMNLSVGGGSVMTGLEVLRTIKYLPKVILIEINILDRPTDQEWVKKIKAASKSQYWAILTGVTKPLRYAFTYPRFSYVSPEAQSTMWKNYTSNLLSQPPSEYDIQSIVSAGLVMWDQRDSWEIAFQNFKRIAELIPEFESQGVQVYFIYMPYVTGYDNHTFAKRNREIASGSETFNCQRCVDVRKLVDVTELRWSDGAHLDDRSAAIVADALQKRFLASK